MSELLFPFFWALSTVGFHIIFTRFFGKLFIKPVQNILVYIIFISNLCLVLMLYKNISNLSAFNKLGYFSYNLITFNCLIFAYFQLFMLSETGRRINILIYIYKNGPTKEEVFNTAYSPEEMIQTRIDRLYKMNWIKLHKKTNKYFVSNNFMLCIAKFFRFFKSLLSF